MTKEDADALVEHGFIIEYRLPEGDERLLPNEDEVVISLITSRPRS